MIRVKSAGLLDDESVAGWIECKLTQLYEASFGTVLSVRLEPYRTFQRFPD